MSSPAASTSGDRKKPAEQITFRFCSECSNMLYPKEDENGHKLMFTCRTCSFSEEATSTCIFRNVLNNAAGETAGVTQDVGSDPTVDFADLASFMANTQDFFGLEDMDVDELDEEPENNTLAAAPSLLSAPSLPRANRTCPACKHDEAVFFQSQQRSAETGMKLFYVCCDCGNIFQ
ncbi:DNA-directed RNA polymerase II core subunit rpb9 [Collariella sp. IMI 366227]|nr:DNA-directed RNA polymerase II core subunit rpb9 [Collariella sp. IMI 366227]